MTPKTDEMIKIGKKGLDLSIFPAWRRSPETQLVPSVCFLLLSGSSHNHPASPPPITGPVLMSQMCDWNWKHCYNPPANFTRSDGFIDQAGHMNYRTQCHFSPQKIPFPSTLIGNRTETLLINKKKRVSLSQGQTLTGMANRDNAFHNCSQVNKQQHFTQSLRISASSAATDVSASLAINLGFSKNSVWQDNIILECYVMLFDI